MSLSIGAITPHPPILIPNIGKESGLKEIKKTIESLKSLEEYLYSLKISTLIVISPPHGENIEKGATLNLNSNYTCSFEQFGDFETKLSFKGNVNLIYNIQEIGKELGIKVFSQESISYAIGAPLYYLTQNLKNVSIVPIYYNMASIEDHIKLGNILKESCMNSEEKIAIIASGDLSHTLAKDAPGGFYENAEKIDQEIINALKGKDLNRLLIIDNEELEKAKVCGIKSIATLLGAFDHINYDFKMLSYEYPFGVGYLTAVLLLK